MDDWEKFNETLLPEKEDFYSHLNMEITRMQKEFVMTWNKKNVENIMMYCQQMYLGALEILVLKHTNLTLQNFFQHLD